MTMASHKLSCYVFILITPFAVLPASSDMLYVECDSSWKFTANSPYQSNLKQLSSTLPSNASSSSTLFATAAVGAIPDTVYALTLCRGDTNPSDCAACIANAFRDAQQVCAYNMDATIYYEPCLLRFSNQNFLTTTENSKRHIMPNGENVTSPAATFDAAVGVLLTAIADYAAFNSSKRFGTGEEDFDKSNPSIYGLAQCTPDMAPADCRGCLEGIVKVMPKHFSRRQGGRILGLRCNYRFELYPPYAGNSFLHLPAPGFVDVVTPPAPESAATPSAGGGGTKTKPIIILAVALGIVCSALIFTSVYFCVSRSTNQGLRSLPYSPNWESVSSSNLPLLDLSILEVATENFTERNKLGEGGFGVVYKGALPDGQEIAVKRLSQGSKQGIGELKNELVLVAKLQHKNLVRLVGVCLGEHENLVIYEYMPNRSLDIILFDPEKSKDLNWGKRLKIINGIARGLQYVHEDSQLRIIHRDLKASNILLDSDLNPKISDFGLARPFEGDQSKDVTLRVVGTFGYMAPEYVVRGIYSIKSDVFSFGILILEIVTGRRNSGSYNSEQSVDLLTLIWENWTKGTILEIIEPFLTISFPEDEILMCVNIGLLCVQEDPADRPTMSAVNAILNSNTVSLQTPSKPAFCIRATDLERHQGGSNADCTPAVISQNEMSATELVPR